ncbi:Uncharacterised protein [Mycobacteroides abscessus subsp. abscessus]|nr:Uncharacterised protein [Mycobacteroides abscessus]SIM54141.1 Uncharacterised protein [Mycobacteroides abscessus subsp. abscessus]SKQ30004.1 Uncharacterised protein [Mycobacteroides abscessus subsp. abscessus]SKS81713.1 Uncharacterised protein [Mycobacteroides abscessus subsp. abscessus]SKX13994.1 Uncharacterised protein [Mycobacteroides abscessus subsp. abscessus]
MGDRRGRTGRLTDRALTNSPSVGIGQAPSRGGLTAVAGAGFEPA